MRKFGMLMVATAFVFSSGFLKSGENGSLSIDTSAAEKQADEALAAANAQVDKAAKQAEEMADAAIDKIQKAAAKITVPKEEIIADLGKSYDEIKKKTAAMDPAQVVAYLSQYTSAFQGTQAKITDYTQQLKDLPWTQKWGKKSKELKTSIKKYNDQFTGLKKQAETYLAQMKSFGLDPAAFGIDLSAYGL